MPTPVPLYTPDEQKHPEALGLSPTEAVLYLVGLRHSQASANELCRLTHIKRPTVYYGLHTLIERGLCGSAGTERKLRYTMATPTQLTRLLEQKAAAIEQEKRSLAAWVETLKTSPSTPIPVLHVVHYEGVEGVKSALNEALYCKQRLWSVIAPYNNVLRSLPKSVQTTYLQTRAQHGIQARTLWEHSPTGHKPPANLQQERQPRYLPLSLQGRFSSMIILFDHKILLLSEPKQPEAIIIESASIHDLLQTMFDGLWEGSTQP